MTLISLTLWSLNILTLCHLLGPIWYQNLNVLQFPQKLNNVRKKTLKLYGPFLWIGVNCLKATEPLRGDRLLFITKSSEVTGTHLIDLGRMKG